MALNLNQFVLLHRPTLNLSQLDCFISLDFQSGFISQIIKPSCFGSLIIRIGHSSQPYFAIIEPSASFVGLHSTSEPLRLQ
jgi:hypothetical protein